MNWMPGATLTERFRAARKLVQSVQTRWTLPTSLSGFIQAQQRWGLVLWPLLCRRLRADEEFGDAWRVNGWLVLAVDGSRYECPRTTPRPPNTRPATASEIEKMKRLRFLIRMNC